MCGENPYRVPNEGVDQSLTGDIEETDCLIIRDAYNLCKAIPKEASILYCILVIAELAEDRFGRGIEDLNLLIVSSCDHQLAIGPVRHETNSRSELGDSLSDLVLVGAKEAHGRSCGHCKVKRLRLCKAHRSDT